MNEQEIKSLLEKISSGEADPQEVNQLIDLINADMDVLERELQKVKQISI